MQDVHPTQDTSQMGTVRAKQEEAESKNNSKRAVRILEERNMDTKEEKSQTGLRALRS